MRASDIVVAARDARAHQTTLCWALEVVIPVLEALASSSAGWKVWRRWGIAALVAALKDYRQSRCTADGAP